MSEKPRLTPFFGIGPGRCGTVTLCEIVAACTNCYATHEAYLMPWYGGDEGVMRELVNRMIQAWSHGLLYGEVQCQGLGQVARLRRAYDGVKIVCLHRPKVEVVRSYLANIKPMFRPGDRVLGYGGLMSVWPARYPIIDAVDVEQSIEFWWELYERGMAEIPPPVFHLKMAGLSDDLVVDALHDFLEIPTEWRRLPEKRVWNTTEERRAWTPEEHQAESRRRK